MISRNSGSLSHGGVKLDDKVFDWFPQVSSEAGVRELSVRFSRPAHSAALPLLRMRDIVAAAEKRSKTLGLTRNRRFCQGRFAVTGAIGSCQRWRFGGYYIAPTPRRTKAGEDNPAETPMVWKRAAGVIVAGTLLAGCNQSGRQTPKASAPLPPMEESQVSNLEQSWRAAHPGSLVGHVNAVDTSRHEASVAGLPLDQIHLGDVISILPNGQSNNVVSARVFGKDNGYVQMDYGPLQAGQASPRDGDLAIWFSPGLTQSEEAAAAAGVNPTTQPGAVSPETTAPPPPARPETNAPAPATAPTPPPPAPETGTPPATQTTTPPPAPDKKLPSDLNK